MSNEVSAVQRLFNACNMRYRPVLNKIDEYIKECRSKNEDMNTLFKDNWNRTLTSLQMVCYFGQYEIVQRLLDSNNNFLFSIDVNAIDMDSSTALHYACNDCIEKCPLTVRILLQHPNIEVNKVNFKGWTPLHVACVYSRYNNRDAIVKELLKHPNIQLTAKDDDDQIPMHYACYCILEDTVIIQALIDHQQQKHKILQLNAKNRYNETPLHLACSHNNRAVVLKLLEHANIMDINATDRDGNTPLHSACKINNAKSKINNANSQMVIIIQNLLAQPMIEINKKNNVGKTPFDIIQQKLDDFEYSVMPNVHMG